MSYCHLRTFGCKVISILPDIVDSGRDVDQLEEILRDICQRYHIRRLLVFGSAVLGSRTPSSDLDLIAEFQPGHIPGFAFARIAEELSSLFECRVDLHTAQSISRYFRDQVLREAKVLYADEE
jgi:uncharacterized protein